ncbi:MAG TPA: hypothetical protein VD970_10650 [Acetobacteraceae bacterium]|nr:hypothetical protein [Acetobacteraceae bacterium]
MSPPHPSPTGPEPAARPATLDGVVLAPVALDRARLLRWLAFIPTALFLAAVLAPPLNHDVAAILTFSERWLGGERLYSDLIDVNPPLIFVLNLVPAAIAAATPLDGPGAFLACMLALCVGVWRLTVLLRRGRVEGPAERAVLTAAIPLLMVLPGYDFGQREHLMALVALPYALLAARRIEGPPVGRGLTAAVAIMAATGFALKPHFLAVPALVEGLILIRRGPPALRDPVPWVMAAAWLLYLASIPILFPDYSGHVLPLVWIYYTDLGIYGFWGVLLSPLLGPLVPAVIALLAAAFLLRASGALVQVFALAALGAFLAAWVQHKGWTYHVAPVLLLAGAAAVILAARLADHALAPARAMAAAPAIALAATTLLGLHALRGGEAPWRQIAFPDDRAARLTEWLRREALGERILVLSPDIYPVYPALNYARAQTTLRTMTLWLLQGVYRDCPADGARYRQTWEMSRTEFFVYRTVAEDFARAPPSAVLVARHSGMPNCGGAFDFIAYFSRHPLFAETWLRYRPAGEIEGYRLYVREN